MYSEVATEPVLSSERRKAHQIATHVFAQSGKQSLLSLRRKQRVEVGAFVGGQMFKEARRLDGRQAVKNLRLEGLGKIAEEGCGDFVVQLFQKRECRGDRQFGKRLCGVGRMRLFDESCKVAGVAGMGQFADETQNFLMGHGCFPL